MKRLKQEGSTKRKIKFKTLQSKFFIMRIKFNMDDTLHLNKRWFRTLLLVFSLLLLAISLTHIFCIIFKPKGYQKIIFVLGESYIQQLLMGLLVLATYFVIKNSNPV